MSEENHTPLSSMAEHVEWLTETLTEGITPGQPVDDHVLNRMVEYLRNFRAFAEVIDGELAACRKLQAEIEARMRTQAASIHPQPEKMQ
ncbi:MAG: hypothetical protein P1V13_22310 [Rhizobiaceae bacterium]|nr:hypothetical protein [Rhizobiaceae bacterium]